MLLWVVSVTLPHALQCLLVTETLRLCGAPLSHDGLHISTTTLQISFLPSSREPVPSLMYVLLSGLKPRVAVLKQRSRRCCHGMQSLVC